MGENQTTTTPASESDGMDTGNFICGMIRSPCGCDPNPDACKICEYGVENPDYIINTDENNQLTCGQGIQMIEMQQEAIDSQSVCDKTKEQVKEGGCVCLSPILSPTDSPSASPNTSPSASTSSPIASPHSHSEDSASLGSVSTKDSAAAYKNIVTLLVISAITTMVAFLG